MAKTFEDVISTLAGLEDGQELVDAAKGRVSKVNQEAAGLRTRLHTAETKLNKVFELTGLTQEDDETVIEQKLKAGKSNSNPDEVAVLKKTVERLDRERNEAIQKNQKSEITSKLLDSLAKNSVLDNWKNVTKDVLALRVKHNATGQIVYVGDDGNEIDFEEGVKSYIASNPALVANNQNPGGGAKPPSGGNGKLRISRDEFNKKSPVEQMEISKEIMSGKGELYD